MLKLTLILFVFKYKNKHFLVSFFVNFFMNIPSNYEIICVSKAFLITLLKTI
jgi:hypothetical protein